jgi:hypothetical protein
MAHVGQRIVYRLASSDYRSARITKIESGTTVTLVAFTTGVDWDAGTPGGVPVVLFGEVAKGTSVGQWQDETTVDPSVSAEIDADVAAEASARDTAIATAAAGRCAVPAEGSSVGLALNTPRQPHATRPVRLSVYGTWAWVLSAIGSQSGTATLKSDSASTPTNTHGVASCSRGISVGVTVGDTGTMPWLMSYEVPAGHYYQIATTGTGTFAITHIDEQVL